MEKEKKVFRSLTMITQFGINMIVPIALMCALGVMLDKHFGTWFFTIILFFLGAAAGARNVYRMAKQLSSDKDKDKETTE